MLIKQPKLPVYKKCTYCDGRGKVWRYFNPADSQRVTRQTVPCPRCKGKRCVLAVEEKDRRDWLGTDRFMGEHWRDHKGHRMK